MIKQLYTIDEIRKKISSNEYNAEMLLQHAMVNIAELELRLAAAGAAIRFVVDIYMIQDGLPDDVREYRTKKAIEFVMMAGKSLTKTEVKGE